MTRRFAVRDLNKKTDTLPVTVTINKKTKNLHRTFRLLAFVAIFFICLSTISVWRRRRHIHSIDIPTINHSVGTIFHTVSSADNSSVQQTAIHQTSSKIDYVALHKSYASQITNADNEIKSSLTHSVHSDSSSTANDSDLHHANPDSQKHSSSSDQEKTHARDTEMAHDQLSHPNKDNQHNSHTASSTDSSSDHSTNSHGHTTSKSSSASDASSESNERLELYHRNDFKAGTRPICHISNPILLSNGTFLLPDWMSQHDKLLKRCALGSFTYYPSNTGPSGVTRMIELDNDFALTIHQERFQEPTHEAPIYLTEHILKASYLFDTFSGLAREVEGIKEHHCYYLPKETKCELKRPPHSLLKPAMFVPKRIEDGPRESWTRKMIDMFGKAHSEDGIVVHLNASSMLFRNHAEQTENLVATRFRSVMSMDGMFRHLPPESMRGSSYYSDKNQISKHAKVFNKDEKCSITIGIAKTPGDVHGMQGTDDFQSKLKVLTKFALPKATVDVKLIEITSDTSFSSHVKDMQDVDIYMAGSGNEMSSIGFLRSSGTAIELMPFGYRPNTHESLARVLGLGFDRISGKPQDESFKTCVDAEVFHLRKKGKIKFSEAPSWKEPLMKAWEAALAEFATSGSSSFDVLTASSDIKNFQSRTCAQKQKIEIDHEEAARRVIQIAKTKCEGGKLTMETK